MIRGGKVDAAILGAMQVSASRRHRQLDDPRQDGQGHGRRDGPRPRRQEGHRPDGAQRQGRLLQDRQRVLPALHRPRRRAAHHHRPCRLRRHRRPGSSCASSPPASPRTRCASAPSPTSSSTSSPLPRTAERPPASRPHPSGLRDQLPSATGRELLAQAGLGAQLGVDAALVAVEGADLVHVGDDVAGRRDGRAEARGARGAVDEGQRDRQLAPRARCARSRTSSTRPWSRVPSAARTSRKGSPLLASRTSSRTTPPGLSRSSGMPPSRGSSQPSGPRKSSFLMSTRGVTPPRHMMSSIMTKSQLDVCGAPTSTPVRGTSPTAVQPLSRSTNLASRLLITFLSRGSAPCGRQGQTYGRPPRSRAACPTDYAVRGSGPLSRGHAARTTTTERRHRQRTTEERLPRGAEHNRRALPRSPVGPSHAHHSDRRRPRPAPSTSGATTSTVTPRSVPSASGSTSASSCARVTGRCSTPRSGRPATSWPRASGDSSAH